MFDLLVEHFEKVGIGDGSGVDGWQDRFEHAEDEGADPREALRNVHYILQLLYLSKIDLDVATKILADGSRVEKWRLLYGEEGILEFYLKCLLPSNRGENDEPSWTSDALRLIGNCCADIDANRERVLVWIDLPFVIAKLGSDEQVDVAIAVLCNLLLDYEPAQKAAGAHEIFHSLVTLIDRKHLNQDPLSRVCELLELASDNISPESCPDDSVAIICTALLASNLEVEDQLSLSNSITALLKIERFQELAIMQDDISLLIRVFFFSYSQGQSYASRSETVMRQTGLESVEPGDEERLSAMRQSLSGAMWDLSALPKFAIQYPLTSDCVVVFVSWLRAWDSDRQLCACYVLRNLASSDETSTQMVYWLHIHEPLLELLKMTTDVPVLGEVLRLLKNLSLPAANRELICSIPEVVDIITGLWSRNLVPTLQQAAASSMRLLLKGCVPNIYLFSGGLSPDHPLDATNRGPLFRLFHLFEASEDPATKIELARILIEIWRTIYTQNPASESNHEITSKMILQAEKLGKNIATPVVWMTMNSENPSLVTEGWFGLTLMASSSEGGEAVWKAICESKAVDLLKGTIGDENPESKDRANALILVDKLLQHKYDEPSLNATLLPLLQGSTNLKVVDRPEPHSGSSRTP